MRPPFANATTNGIGGAAVGDLYSTRANFNFATYVGNSSAVTFTNYTVFTGGFGILEAGGQGGNIYKNYRDTFGPMPTGAGRQRLVSTNADAFHSSNVRVGPQLTGCLFEGMTDDGININGSYGKVVSVTRQYRHGRRRHEQLSCGWRPFALYGPKRQYLGRGPSDGHKPTVD